MILKNTQIGLIVFVTVFFLNVATSKDRVPQELIMGQMINFSVWDEARAVPDKLITDAADKKIRLSDLQGKVLLVNFWATWCALCRRELPDLENLQTELGGDNFSVVLISQDSEGKSKAIPFLEDFDINLVTYMDADLDLGKAMGAINLPVTVLLDRKGREIGRVVGIVKWDSPEAIVLIQYFIDRA